MNINNWINYNGSEYTINGKTYRNLEAQVLENMKNIQDIDISGLETEVQNLGNQVDTNTNNISTNTNSINSINGEIVTINNDIDDLQTQYGSLDTFQKARVTLYLDGWDANDEQTVTVTGLTDTDTVWMTPAMISGYEDYMMQVFGESGVYIISGSDDELTFKALRPENLPTEVDIYADIVFTHVVADSGGGGTSTPELYWVDIESTTYAEITSALQNGLYPIINYNNGNKFFVFTLETGGRYYFEAFITGAVQYYYVDSNDVWTYQSVTYQNTANRVTTISDSSTDTQYPSAKCVYDAIQGAIPSDYIFDATASGTSVTLSNSKTAQDIVDAFDGGANEVFIRIVGTNGRYDKYRVCIAYNFESHPQYATIYTDPIAYSVMSTLNVRSIYFPGLTATGNVLTIKEGAI